jgi:hypothetical protein
MAFGDTIAQTVLGKPTDPEDTDNAPNVIAEGAAVNTSVGITAHSTFAGGDAGLTYSLSADSSAGGFKIDPNTGVVTVADPSKIDFETSPGHVYTITVEATKNSQFSSEQTFTISVTDVAPSTPVDSNAAANTVAEGAANGTAVGITASSTDVNGPAVTWSLTGDTSGGGFTINATTGVITVADGTKIDYESAPGHAYTVTATASDGTLTSSHAFTINVSDVALPTPVDTNAAANSVAEGAANGSTVGVTASANDPNGPATTYSLIGDTSGGGFAINATTGVVTVADGTKIDYESSPGHAYTITVQANDGLQTTSQTFTIGVTDVAPSTPVDLNGAANTVVEGAANGSTVGVTASSTDVNGPAVTYSLTGDTSGGGFTINAATGVVTVADSTKIDFETAAGHAYTVTAQASDGTLTSSQTFTIAVTDVAPSTPVDSNAAGNSVAEGAANGSTVGITASSTDINGPAVTYSLIGDTTGGGYTINSATGVVTVADGTKIDYESAPGHNDIINVQASDGTLTSTQFFTIAVSDVAPSQPVDSNAAANTVAEGAAINTTVGVTASSTDVNGGAVTYALGIDSSGGGFKVDATTGVISVADPTKIDYESSGPSHAYTVSVVASDGTIPSSGQTFTIAVTDVAPSTPVDSNAAANTVVEGAANGTTVGVTASSTDVNGPAVTYSLIGDTSGGGFTINAATGVVTVADSTKVDFESSGGSYTVTAQASDGTLSSSQTFTIAVTDVAPSTPVDSDAGANTVAEGAANGSTVGVTASSTDINGPAVTYTLTGDTSGGGFTINSATGVVTVADPTKIDYESAPGHAYTVTAQASDGTLSSSQSFTIAVTDVAPSTPVDSNAATNTIAEGAANGSTVGVTASSTDVNGPAVTYSLTGDTSGGGFTINSATGVVTVADGTKIDYESSGIGHSYTVTAQASDGTLTSSQTFTIAVTDVAPSTPVDSDAAANQVAAGAPVGTHVGVTASSTDVNGPAVTYSLVGDTSGGGFTINSATGLVTVADPSKIVYNAGSPTFDVTVDSSDGTLHSQQTFTINVILDAAPVVTAGHTLAYTENQAATAIDPAVTVTDSDSANLAHATVQITGNYVNGQDVLAFTNTASITGVFNAATGTMTLSGSDTVAHYQSALEAVTYFNNSDNPSGAARTVTIVANDGVLDSSPATDTINVTPVNDPPVVTAGHTFTYTENQAATPFDPALAVSDVDNTTLASATVQISGNYVNGQDILAFTNTASITGVFNAANGTLTLTGTDTVADYQAALDSVTYFNNSDNPSGLARTVTVIANDGAANSSAATDTINVIPVNDPPVTTAGGTLNYTENQAATAIDTTVTVNDVDNANLASATVQITGNYANGQDILAFTNTASITGVFNAATGTLTLTGSDTLAHYQAALHSVTYLDNSDDPSGLARTVSFTVNDGAANSNTSTSTINVTPVDDAPVNSKPAAQTILEDHSLTFSSGGGNAISVSDPDVESGNLQVNLGVSHGTLTLSGTSGLTVSGNGTAAVQLTGTTANINAALNGLVYAPAANFNGTPADSLTIATNDLGNTGTGGPLTTNDSVTINITPVNDPPSFTLSTNHVTTTEDSGAQTVTGVATSISPGPPDESGQTVHFNVTNDSNPSMFLVAPAISSTGTLTYTAAANYAGTASITVDAQDNGGTANGGVDTSGTQTFIIDVSPVADTPTFTTALTPVAFSNEAQADTVSSGIQNTAAVAALLNGGYVVGWQDTNVGNTEIQIYNASGAAVGSNIAVSDGANGVDETDANSLSINGLMAGTYAGGFLVTDMRQDAVTGNSEIEGRIFTSTGTLSGPGSDFFEISPQVTGASGDLQVALPSASVFSDGGFAVVWEHVIDGNDSVIDVQRFNSAAAAVHQNGTTAGLQDFQANTGSTGVAEFPDIAVLSNGNFVVTWDFTPVNTDATKDVFYQVFNSAGTAIGSQTEANTTTADAQEAASVAALAGGGFAISWTSNNEVSAGSQQDIYVRLFNASGTATSGEILVDTTTTGVQDTSNILALPDGGFLVTWDSNQDTGGSNGVFAQRFNASGQKVGAEFEINQTTSGAQQQHTGSDHDPQAVLNNGQVVSAWDSNQIDGGDIFARRFTVPGDGPENGTVTISKITALVTDNVGNSPTNGGQEIIKEIDLSGIPTGVGTFTFSVGHAGSTAGTWVIDNSSDIASLASTALTMTPPSGYTGNFTLSATATVTDTATLSTGTVTDTLVTSALTIPIGVKAPGDPIFAADSAAPFNLSLDPVANGDTVSITSLPGNGQIEYADGSAVATGAVLTAAQFALLKFAPSDLGADTAASFEYSVSDGTTQTLNTVPINLVHGTGVTIDGSVGNDHVIGSPGNDILNGGPGHDVLTGGAGADHFVFDQTALADATAAAPQIDNVTDYSAAQGDVIDLTALFSGATVASQSLSSLVHATEDASGTFATLQVNTAATGQAAHWVDIAQLDGVKDGDAIKVSIDPGHPAVSAQIQSQTVAEQAQGGALIGSFTVVDNFAFTPPVQPAVSPPPPVETVAARGFGATGGFDFSLLGQGFHPAGDAAPVVQNAGATLTPGVATSDAATISYSTGAGGIGGYPAGPSGTHFGDPVTDAHTSQNHVDLLGWIV